MQLKLILLAIAASIVVSAKALPQLDDTTAALLGIDDFEDVDDGDFEDSELVARGFNGPGSPISFIPTEALPKHKHHKHHKHHRGGRKHRKKQKQHHDGHLPTFAYPNRIPILP